MTITRRLFALGTALGLVSLTLPMTPGAAQAATWDMPTPYPDNNFHTLNHKQFAQDLAAVTGDAVSITVHPAGSLFKHADIKNAVRSGQVPIGEFLLSRLANENPIYEADSVPFLADSYEDAEKLWAVQRPLVEDLLDREGLMVLYAVPWPPQGIYAKKEVASIHDMAGVKFRAYNTATEQLANLAGAVPTQVEVPDIPQAFSTGRVDAMITSPSTGANAKAWDFLSHYHDTQAWLPKNIVVANKRAFQRLDEDTQAAILAAASAAEARGWAASRAETEKQTQALADNGITVLAPSPALGDALSQIGEQMIAEWVEKAGDAGQTIVDGLR